MDVQFVEADQRRHQPLNDRTLPVLTAITGQDLGVEPEKWKSWWTDQLGYAYQSRRPKPSPLIQTSSLFYSTVPLTPSPFPLMATEPASRPAPWSRRSTARRRSNRSGLAIASCRRSTSTGQLAFQPVVATHRNPSNPTLRIAIGGESIVATGIHRFWKAGKGWTMARELKAGDRLRMVGGTVEIRLDRDRQDPARL